MQPVMEKMEKDVEMAKLKESIAVYIFVQQKWDENKRNYQTKKTGTIFSILIKILKLCTSYCTPLADDHLAF